jgi:uncharacterized protein with FMN-binding domain
MKTGRSVILVAASASMLAAGWAAGSGLVSPQGATNSASRTSLGAPAQGASGASGASGKSSSSTGTTAKTSPATAPKAAAPPKAAAGASGKFKGSAVPTRYGSFQVQITVAAGKITDISMLQSGSQDGTSQEITGYALPLLIQAVLQQQKANVGYVSGASYTTQGFEGAVQSAMQAAGLA